VFGLGAGHDHGVLVRRHLGEIGVEANHGAFADGRHW